MLKRVALGLLRIWLGYQWLTAGLHKVTDPKWVGSEAGTAVSGFLKGALAKAAGDHPAVQSWYAAFIEKVALPNATLFSYLVAFGEVLVGIGLITGTLTVVAALAGAFMNLNFLLAGTTSTNPILLTAAVILLFGRANAGFFGIDQYLVPRLRELAEQIGTKFRGGRPAALGPRV